MSNYDCILKNKRISQLPWTEKYRPKKIEEIMSHNNIIFSLKSFIAKKSLPHLLFYGPSGSGKTSTIKCCTSEIYGRYVDCMILELNASNERGIETVRTKIKNFVCNKNSIFLPSDMHGIFKMVILDEIDSMTVEAQSMLRQTIEKHSPTTRFCLICNDIDKINPALQSRCAHYRFPPLKVPDMEKKLHEICDSEKIIYEKVAINAIIKISKGDMRAAINILQHVNLTVNGNMTEENVYKISGNCTPKINTLIFNKLMKLKENKMSLLDCIDKTTDIIVDNNMTIFNLLEELKNSVVKSNLLLNQKIFLIDNLAQNEVFDTVNVDPKNIIMIIASLFVISSKIKK